MHKCIFRETAMEIHAMLVKMYETEVVIRKKCIYDWLTHFNDKPRSGQSSTRKT